MNPQLFKLDDHIFLLKGPKPEKFEDQYTGLHEVLEILYRNKLKSE